MTDIAKIAHEGPRIETGPIQFGDDWPGVFIRGDNAMHYAMLLTIALEHEIDADPLRKGVLRALARLLASCDTRAALAAHRAAGLTKAHYNVLPQATLAAQRAMGLVLVPVDMWKLEAVKDAYAQFLADAGLKNAPSLEHLLPELIAAAQGKNDA